MNSIEDPALSYECDLTAERDALRAEVANYEVLKRAVNESTNECSTQCDEHGHAGDCPANNSARWLEDQQREIESLRAELAALKEKLPCGHPKNMDDSYGGCVWCTMTHTLTTLEDEYDALRAATRKVTQNRCEFAVGCGCAHCRSVADLRALLGDKP